MYNGQWGKGMVYLGLTIGEFVMMVATMPCEEPGYWEAGYYEWNEETWEYEWVPGQWVEGEEHGNAEVFALSIVALLVTRLVDIIDAPISAARINRQHGWIGSIEMEPIIRKDYAGLKLIQRF